MSVLSIIRKSVEGRKLTDDPKTYQKKKNIINLVICQISELKNDNFYTIFVVNIFAVCLFAYFLCFNSNKCALITS